jgi:CheY-like chemotaxis protein
MRIFVIDDEVAVAETLGELVADLGHHASVAHSAEAAVFGRLASGRA